MKKQKINRGKTKKPKRRAFKHFNLEERIRIELKHQEGHSIREIALHLGKGRTAGSVCREINGKPRKGIGKYQAHTAHEKALNKRFGKKGFRLKNDSIKKYVVEKLKLGWSPEQISIRLQIDQMGQSISYEAIYQYIYLKTKDEEDLRIYLVRRHKQRRKKGLRKGHAFPRRESLPSIEDRPAHVLKRKEVGHFEDDLVVSREGKSQLKTINERSVGIVFLKKIKDGTSEESTKAVCDRLKEIPSPYLKTLTRDNGSENLGWKDIERILNIKVYFAHPYCSYERGSNENLNGLVRRFFPKKTNFDKVSDEEIRKVEYLINSRPRKRFGGKTPLEVLYERTGVAITY